MLDIAELADELTKRKEAGDAFERNWERIVTKWRETSRYDRPDRPMAEELIRAIGDTKAEVLPWIKLHW